MGGKTKTETQENAPWAGYEPYLTGGGEMVEPMQMPGLEGQAKDDFHNQRFTEDTFSWLKDLSDQRYRPNMLQRPQQNPQPEIDPEAIRQFMQNMQ